MTKPVYRRVLLKLSGEALLGNEPFGIDSKTLSHINQNIHEIVKMGAEIAIVIGGGNFFRGELLSKNGFDRVTCDQMGMLATVMNGLVLRDSFLKNGLPCHIMSSISIEGFTERYNRSLAVSYLENKAVVIFVAGTGNPLFSTDSAASLRGIEIGADVILKATKVDGVYSKDPKLHADAERFDHLTYQEVIERHLAVMDMAAISLCQDHAMPLRVFDMNSKGILKRIITGSNEGTLIS